MVGPSQFSLVAAFFEPLRSHRRPEAARAFSLVTAELVGHPEQRAVDDGAVVAGELDDARLDHKPAEFDQMPCALAALDLPVTHVMPRPCRLIASARCLIAAEG